MKQKSVNMLSKGVSLLLVLMLSFIMLCSCNNNKKSNEQQEDLTKKYEQMIPDGFDVIKDIEKHGDVIPKIDNLKKAFEDAMKEINVKKVEYVVYGDYETDYYISAFAVTDTGVCLNAFFVYSNWEREEADKKWECTSIGEAGNLMKYYYQRDYSEDSPFDLYDYETGKLIKKGKGFEIPKSNS